MDVEIAAVFYDRLHGELYSAQDIVLLIVALTIFCTLQHLQINRPTLMFPGTCRFLLLIKTTRPMYSK